MAALRQFALDHGLYFYTHWHTILILPPLVITEDQLQQGFKVLEEGLKITDRASNEL